MSMKPDGEVRRYAMPPLWSVPVLLIAAIVLIYYVSIALGILAIVPAALAVVWLQRKADVYVRTREANS